jgi:HAE1 family hydrophobic/amphiphilic exporter-1
VGQALDAANVSAPGGTIMQGRFRFPLRTLGEFTEVEEIDRVVVDRQSTQVDTTFRMIRVRDIGEVVDGFAERESMAFYNGREAVGLLVFKESGANTVTVAEAVEEVLEQLRGEYPEIALDVAYSQAGFISESISNVVQALVFGGMLAFLVLFLFLRDSRYPFAIAAAIPISVVGTFALMEAAGVSLNIMSLGGLALGVGMLVDNSIVVLENIFRHREEGKPGIEAAAVGAEEVQGAITASTLTTISVFGPIIYVEGVAGELFSDLSLAVAFSLIASLVVALTLLPTLAARFAGPGGSAPSPGPVETQRERPRGAYGWASWAWFSVVFAPFRVIGWFVGLAKELLVFWWTTLGRGVSRVATPFLQRFDRAFDRFAGRYHGALEWSLDNRVRVLGMAGLALSGSLALGWTLDRDLLPQVDQGAFDMRLELAEGTAIEATAEAADAIEERLLEDGGVEAVFGQVGRDVRAYAEGEEDTGLNTARFQVRLRDGVRTADVVGRLDDLRERFPEGALTIQSGQATALGAMLGGSDADVSVRIRGEDLDAMMARAEEVRGRLAGLSMLDNVRVGAHEGMPQVNVEILEDRALAYGIEPRTIADVLGWALRGYLATEFVDFDRKIPVMVSFPAEQRYSREALQRLRIDGVPLTEVVAIREGVGPAEVIREEQGRTIPVFADVARGGLDDAVVAIRAELDDYPATREMRMDVGGENEEMRRSFRDLSFAFGLALVLVYMILAAQFESFVHPFTILTAVPLALVGAIAALWIAGEGLNTMSLIGVVILVGIVVNDSIVKVDFIVQARAAGRGLRDAILEAGRVRLRPIVMTTVTTVLGLTPMALGIGRGADLRAPLAIAVIGGLIVATLLTLIVVPVVYAVVDDLRSRVARTVGRGSDPAPVPAGGD